MRNPLALISRFLKDKDFVTFALFCGLVYFTQLYIKLGYLVTSIAFGEGSWIALISGVVFGLFAGTANASLVLNNKQEDSKINRELMGFDMVISFFFYGDSVIKAVRTGDNIGSAIASLFLSFYASRLLYFLAERFRQDNLEWQEAEARTKQDRASVELLLANVGVQGFDATASVATLLELVATQYKTLANDSDTVAKEAQTLRPLQETVVNLRQMLETQSTEFEQARKLLAENQEKLRQERETNQALQENLSQAVGELREIREGDALKTEKGTLKKFLRAGENEKAEAKVKEIKQKFGVALVIDWQDKTYKEVA